MPPRGNYMGRDEAAMPARHIAVMMDRWDAWANALAAAVHERLVASGIAISTLAEATGLAPSTLHRLTTRRTSPRTASGKRRSIQMRNLYLIAAAIGCDVRDLLPEDSNG